LRLVVVPILFAGVLLGFILLPLKLRHYPRSRWWPLVDTFWGPDRVAASIVFQWKQANA
jgi:hypothetical protein